MSSVWQKRRRERVRSSPRMWRTVTKRQKRRSSQIFFAKNFLFGHPVLPTVRGTGSHLKVGIRSAQYGATKCLSQRKIFCVWAYSKRFWIRPIHFFCAFHEPFVKRSPHLKHKKSRQVCAQKKVRVFVLVILICLKADHAGINIGEIPSTSLLRMCKEKKKKSSA